jgi:hypothetical protein
LALSPAPSLARMFPLRVSAPPSNGLAAVPFAPEGVAFFFPVPPMDAHGNQEEQAWPETETLFVGKHEAPAGEFFLCLFALPLFSLILGFRFLCDGESEMNKI